MLRPWSERIELAFVSGETIGGTGRAGGTVRLVVVGRPDLLLLHRALGAVEGDLGRSVDLNVYDPTEWEELGKGPWLSGMLAAPRTMVTGDDPAPRHWADPPPYAPAPPAAGNPGPEQVAGHVLDAGLFLKGSRTETMSPLCRYHLAGEGIHCLALAVLRHSSVGSDGDVGQRTMALQALMRQAGLGTDAIRLVSQAHRNRNSRLGDEWNPAPSEADADALVQVLGTTFAAVRFLVEGAPLRGAGPPPRRR